MTAKSKAVARTQKARSLNRVVGLGLAEKPTDDIKDVLQESDKRYDEAREEATEELEAITAKYVLSELDLIRFWALSNKSDAAAIMEHLEKRMKAWCKEYNFDYDEQLTPPDESQPWNEKPNDGSQRRDDAATGDRTQQPTRPASSRSLD